MNAFFIYIDAMVEEKIQQRVELQVQRQLPAPPLEEMLTIEQTAALLHVTRQTIHNRVRQGILTAYKQDPTKPGSSTYFIKSEVLATLQALRRPDGRRKNARRQFSPAKQSF
jgi:hypothetical protein